MTRTLKISLMATVGALVGTIALAGAAPAFAASAATDAYVANVHPNADFLDKSSRLAMRAATSAKVRAFARDEATDQTLAGNQLVAWTETQTPAGVAAATASVDVPNRVATGVDDIVTGRSVAIDAAVIAPAITATRTPAPGTLLPSEETDMSRLTALSGRRFDIYYKTTQTDALRQLVTLYTDYMRDGDDAALRAMAARQLPIVHHRLEQLHAL